MALGKIEVSGLRELQRSLRAADAALPRQLRLVFNEAMDLIIDYARPRMPSISGRARGSLKGRSAQRTARIAMGGSRAPYTPWLDFGGEGRVKGRPPLREFLRTGRYVYKGLEVRRDEVTEVMAAGLTRVVSEAGLEVS